MLFFYIVLTCFALDFPLQSQHSKDFILFYFQMLFGCVYGNMPTDSGMLSGATVQQRLLSATPGGGWGAALLGVQGSLPEGRASKMRRRSLSEEA